MALKNYFPGTKHISKAEFDSVLDKIHYHADFFSYIAHVKSGEYSHTSPSFEKITGYSVSIFEQEGVNFYLSRVPQEDILKVMERQAQTFKEAFMPGFNPELPNFVEMGSRFVKSDGSSIQNIALATAFAYLPNGEFDFALVGVFVEAPDKIRNQKLKGEMEELLGTAKKLYRTIYPQQKFQIKENGLTEIVFEKQPNHTLSTKEKEVLKKIAKGLSTKEIASALGISENTVESHRKKMLQKLEAKNVAELIKKASKLYWLE